MRIQTLHAKAIGALSALMERGGVAALDLKKARLSDEGGRWLAPLADALTGATPRRPQMRWPLGALMSLGGKHAVAISSTVGGRALVEPLLEVPASGPLTTQASMPPARGAGSAAEYCPPGQLD